MTIKELKRAQVLQEVEAGRMTGVEAAEMLGLSVRQVRRLQKTFRAKGAEGLAHGNRGKPSARRMPGKERKRILKLIEKDYRDYNTQHLMEELEREHGIVISYSALRRLRNAANLPSPRKRRVPGHRSRRERRPMAGMLLQADGSEHDWLEGRGPRVDTPCGRMLYCAQAGVIGILFRYPFYATHTRTVSLTHVIGKIRHSPRRLRFFVAAAARRKRTYYKGPVGI